jgi:hypothetical protein
MNSHDSYLGDGVYASFDGYHVILELRAQPPTTPTTRIALEPAVFDRLVEYRARIIAAYKREEQA